MRCGRWRSRGLSRARACGIRGGDGRVRVDRPVRAAGRSAAALGAGVGRDRGSGPGAARCARHPAQAPRLLHRRAEQEVERRCLSVHRDPPSAAVDHRGQRDLSRLVRRRQPGGRVGQQGVRRRARRGPRRARRFLRDAARRHDQDGGLALRRLPAARDARGPVAARLGRAIRPGLGAAACGVHPAHRHGGPDRAVRRLRAGPAARRAHCRHGRRRAW